MEAKLRLLTIIELGVLDNLHSRILKKVEHKIASSIAWILSEFHDFPKTANKASVFAKGVRGSGGKRDPDNYRPHLLSLFERF